MKLDEFVKQTFIVAMGLAVICALYIFVVTILKNETGFIGFYNNWQLPMVCALFIDALYYEHFANV